jgi:hypothetical protein
MPEHFEPPDNDPEINHSKFVGSTLAQESHPLHSLIQKNSNLCRLKRIIAWVLRFIHNRSVPAEEKRLKPYALIPELREAEVILVRLAQQESYKGEYRNLEKGNEIKPDSPIITLTPFFDSKAKIIRVGGRLGYCNFPTDIKHPILLPSNHHVTNLIVQQAHLLLRHATAERTLVAVHKKYWIPRGRTSVNSIIRKCFDCKRFRAKPDIPLMSPLPAHRLQDDRPAFSNTGIDYFGPIVTTVRLRKEKRWGIIFTCLVSRAVHFEMAYSLDTSSFLLTFWRFSRRRIRPDVVYSDNGTNLTAGEKELKAGLERLNQTIIAEELGAQNIERTFSPPSAPHFGGAWESFIKTAKDALCFILQDHSFPDEVLISSLVEVESIMNDRPIGRCSTEPNDPAVLTPNHLLLGRANPSLPADVIYESNPTSRQRWRNAQIIGDHFWRRWTAEVVPSLLRRKKWFADRRHIQVGDLVLVIDPNAPKGRWPISRVDEVYPGKD